MIFEIILGFLSINFLLSNSEAPTEKAANYIKIINQNNITIGSLPNQNNVNTTVENIIKNILKLNNSKLIEFTKIENQNHNSSIKVLKADTHPFIQAVHLAYANHLPLHLTPDIIWYLIASGTAIHINKNAERLRNKFVEHHGKKKITVRRDNFIFESATNPWDEVIDEFSEKIEKNSKFEISKLFKSNFSTTTKESLVVSQIVLMDAMKKYFSYSLVTLCGIPELKIHGSQSDWQLIKNKVNELKQLIDDLSFWYDTLDEIINQFIGLHSSNTSNEEFWSQIYKIQGGSGGPYISGWTLAFFPYLNDGVKNHFVWEKKWLDAYNNKELGGLTTRHFSMSLNRVPFKWLYFNKEYNMFFIGGLFGVHYNLTDKSLRPLFGYGICQDTSKIKH